MTERDNVLEYTCHRLEVLIGMSEIKIRDFNTFQFKVKPIDDNVAIVSGKASIVSIESSDSELEFVQKKPQGKLEIKKTLENRSRSPPRWSNEQ